MAQKFRNVRETSSPSSQSSHYSQSIVVNRSNYPASKLQFGGNTNLISSQASYRTSNNPIYQSQISQSNFFNSQVSQSSVRNFYKGLGTLPQERLKQIAQNFIKLYGYGGEIRGNQVQKIQQIAHEKDSKPFQQTRESSEEFFQVMDHNRDKRVTQQDIYMLCRRYLNCEKKPIVYTPMVEERLTVARRLFKQFDVEKKGYLTEKQVPNLLKQTYKTLGRDFKATEDDIRSWMKLADDNNDGHVTLVQYQRSIIRALKKQGIKIYED